MVMFWWRWMRIFSSLRHPTLTYPRPNLISDEDGISPKPLHHNSTSSRSRCLIHNSTSSHVRLTQFFHRYYQSPVGAIFTIHLSPILSPCHTITSAFSRSDIFTLAFSQSKLLMFTLAVWSIYILHHFMRMGSFPPLTKT